MSKTPRFTEEISIHALREEGDDAHTSGSTTKKVFLSTPSARRATFRMLLNSALISLFLSTPSARRATRCGADFANLEVFLSTPSARRATVIAF